MLVYWPLAVILLTIAFLVISLNIWDQKRKQHMSIKDIEAEKSSLHLPGDW